MLLVVALCCADLADCAAFGRGPSHRLSAKRSVPKHGEKRSVEQKQERSVKQKNARKVPKLPKKRTKRWLLWPFRKKQKPKRVDVVRERLLMEGERVRSTVDRVVQWWHLDRPLDERWYNRALFLASNLAYMGAGGGLLMLTKRREESPPPLLAWLMFAACGYSTTYHAMQCAFGADSDQARTTGRVDVFLAMCSACYFYLEVGCSTWLMQGLALAAGGMFIDLWGLGYTASHSLWHLFGAALSFVGGLQWRQDRRAFFLRRRAAPAAPPGQPLQRLPATAPSAVAAASATATRTLAQIRSRARRPHEIGARSE